MLLDRENALQSVLPEVFLLTLGDMTALLVTYLDDVSENLVKLLDVLVRSLHLVRERDIKERVDDVSAEIHEHFRVQLDRLVVILIALVKHRTRFLRTLLLADTQAFVDREVAPRHIVHNLGLVLLVAQDLDKLQKQVDELLTRAVAVDHAAVLALLDYPLLVLRQDCGQEIVRKIFLLLELPGNRVVVAFEPLVAELDRLDRVHLNKFGNMLLNELFHLLQSHSVRHSFLLEEAILSFILVI